MVQVALLRGVNVGGRSKVEMPRLRTVFETAGLESVRTYINSGNVIFTGARLAVPDLTSRLENAIASEFGFEVKLLIRDFDTMSAIEAAIPSHWVTDSSMRTDVMFLWDEIANPGIVDELPVRKEVDNVLYASGAIIWQVDAVNLNRSGRTKVIGGQVYRSATVRNANTVRKLVAMMRESQ